MNDKMYNELKNLDIKINILKNSCEIGKIEKNTDPDLECAICLRKISINKNYKLLPECGHKFHIKCINNWLDKNNTCPCCRLNY
jgi:hypothetical protein